jgi:arginine/ornithine transport system substrate-binding protein
LTPAGVSVVGSDAKDQVYMDIKAGRLDGTVADVIEVEGGFLSTPDGKNHVFVGSPLSMKKYFGEGVGVALRKGNNDLKAILNKAIGEIRADGTWKKISEEFVPGADLWGQ